MDPDMAKSSRFKWFKFVPSLISMWGIRKCHHFNPKLPTFVITSSFTAYLNYVLYGTQNGRIKQIGVENQICIIKIYQYKTCLFLLQVYN